MLTTVFSYYIFNCRINQSTRFTHQPISALHTSTNQRPLVST